jgi:hypothetical protein
LGIVDHLLGGGVDALLVLEELLVDKATGAGEDHGPGDSVSDVSGALGTRA